jgi:hypothetical protein
MDTAIIVALITAVATVIAAAIAILPRVLRKVPVNPLPGSSSPASEGGGASNTRRVYFKGAQYRFLNFGGKNCRIEPAEGGQSFLAPTHELFHDAEQTRRITRESIVVRT